MKRACSYGCFLTALLLPSSPLLAQGVLADPGFESGALVPGAVGGWDIYAGSPTLVQSLARSGTWSLQANYSGTQLGASMVSQWVAVQPGLQYTLSGWGLTPIRLDSYRSAYLYLRFADRNHVPIGQGTGSGMITSASAANTWISLSTTATAPADAAYAQVALGVGMASFLSPWSNAIYFDDVSLTPIPEPGSLALLPMGLGLWLWSRRGHRGITSR